MRHLGLILFMLLAPILPSASSCGEGDTGPVDAGEKPTLTGEVSYAPRNVFLDLHTGKEKADEQGLGPQDRISSTKIVKCVWNNEEKLTLQFGKADRKSKVNETSYVDFSIEDLPFDGKHFEYVFQPGDPSKRHNLCARTSYKGEPVGVCSAWMPDTNAECVFNLKKGSWKSRKNRKGEPVIDFEGTFYCRWLQFKHLSQTTRLVSHLGSKDAPGTLKVSGCKDGTVDATGDAGP